MDPIGAIAKEFVGDPGELIPLLQRVQAVEGFLSEESVRFISRFTKLSENEIYGVASFYAQFRFARPGEHSIKVCLGTACHVRGGEQILGVLSRTLEINPGEITADGKYQLDRVACLGCCALAPVVSLDDKIYGQTTVLKVREILDEHQ